VVVNGLIREKVESKVCDRAAWVCLQITKIFCLFTLPPVDERMRFPYSGDNFLHPGNYQ